MTTIELPHHSLLTDIRRNGRFSGRTKGRGEGLEILFRETSGAEVTIRFENEQDARRFARTILDHFE